MLAQHPPRNRSTLIGLAMLLLIAAPCASARSPEDGSPKTGPPNAEQAATAVLDRFLGHWQTHTQIHHSGPPPRDFDTRGHGDCQRTLDGRFVEFRTESIPPGDSDLQVMTYDSNAGVYRQWLFSSHGYTHEASGLWDPATSTLRWEGKSSDSSFVIVDHWTNADHLEWTLDRVNRDGQPLQSIRGTLERAK